MQISPHISLGSNEENKKALTPDEKEMAFEMTHTLLCSGTPKKKKNRNKHCHKIVAINITNKYWNILLVVHLCTHDTLLYFYNLFSKENIHLMNVPSLVFFEHHHTSVHSDNY